MGPQRVLTLGALVIAFALLFLLQKLIWPTSRPGHTGIDRIVWVLSFAWALPLPSALLCVAGFVINPGPAGPHRRRPISTLVCYRIVSRGQNADMLRRTIENVREQMAHLALFPYRIEVVTDLRVELPLGDDIVHFVVPREYQTSKGSLFKARALQYALECSDLSQGAWIMHLDEESQITSSLIAGVCSVVREEEMSGLHRIGQGVILYHRRLESNPILTLADSIRTGDDLGRFYLQHRLGVTLFGLHGSFILVRNSVEKEVGFDFGPSGSITEDAFWALIQMNNGRRSRWVDGYMVEQATESAADFVKQRRRWFSGLIRCAFQAPVRPRFRVALGLSMLTWSVSWLGLMATVMNLFVGERTPLTVHLIGNFVFATYLTCYVAGLKINLDNLEPNRVVHPLRTAVLYLLQVILVPLFSVMETAGILYGLLNPTLGFHVVRKSAGLQLPSHPRPVFAE